MKVGIMQPYVFPYIGYYQLINYVDKWVVFDDSQYKSKSWINRNRILHPEISKEWQYFTVPVKKHSLSCRIKEIEINNDVAWREEFLGKLTIYKKAPFYHETIEFVRNCLSYNSSSLSQWTIHTLKETCRYLGIPFEYYVFSEMEIDTSEVRHSGQWASVISTSMNASEYINPPDGYKLFREVDFKDKNIELKFLSSNILPYSQGRDVFTPRLSIIDIMMWNDNVQLNDMLTNYSIYTYSEMVSK